MPVGLLVYFSVVVYSLYKDLTESTFDVKPFAPDHTTTTIQTVVPSAPCTMPQQTATIPVTTTSHYSQGVIRHYPVL